MGFSIDEKHLRRAGLDYWDKLDVFEYKNLDDFFTRNEGGEFFFFSTKAKKSYTEVKYPEDAYLIFGKETKGLPEPLIFSNMERAVRIPMRKTLRCLNLSNSVAIAAYEYFRQYDFKGLV